MLNFYGFLVVAVLFGLGQAAAAPPPVMEHDLTVRLEPSKQLLQATDVVTMSNSGESRVVFELADHMSVKGVILNGRQTRFSFKNGRVRIPLPATGDPSLRLRIAYGGRFIDEVSSAPLNTDNPGFGVTGTINSRGTMLLSGAKWYPRAEKSVSVYNITINAPDGVVAVTSGRSLGHSTEKGRTLSRWKVEQPLRGIPLVAGPYTVTTRQFGRITAATYFSPSLQHLSDDYLGATGRYLQLYQDLFGPYPFGQFAVVENFFPTGYGFPSFTLLGRRVLQLPFIIHTSLGHEIAHCWWGNGVLVDPSAGNWSEGLTSYVADYLYKERRGEGRSYRLQWLRNYANLVTESKDFPVSQFFSRVDPATKVIGYDKAAMVFHMLRQIIGEDMFWSALRDIYAGHRFKAISWPDIQAAFEKHANISLEDFFRQWVYRAGAPKLSLSSVRVEPKNHGFEVRGVVLQEKPFYDLHLDLVLNTDQDPVSQVLKVTGARTPFSFTVSRPPKSLKADPEAHLFRRLSPQEVPATVNTLKGASAVTVVVAKHLGSEGVLIARRLSVALGLSDPRIGLEEAFSPSDLRGRDLLYVGMPSDRKRLPSDVAQFDMGPETFALNGGETHDRKQASFFCVYTHPDEKGTSALFIPSDLSVGKVLTTKIPHYGKYSYLVFKGTRNQEKGTWAVTRSPMVVRWPADPNALAGGTR